MKYDFDTVVDRCCTDSLKYDFILEKGKPKNILPLWIADMDFKVPNEVAQAIRKTADHGIYGYTEPKEPYFAALSGWFSRRFNYPIEREWVIKTPGVVFALALAIRAFTQEGDSVIIQSPVYYPFSQVILSNKRRLVDNPLVLQDGKYQIDFEDFERKIISNRVKLFILCSPHNPVGRVWTRGELVRLGEICQRCGCIVVSDEIHCDFVHPGHKHHVFPSLSKELAQNTVLCTAPSKTFNLAGLQVANIIIPNPKLKAKMLNELKKTGYSQLNTTGLAACQSAYEHGENWLNSLLLYLNGNLAFVKDFLVKNLPNIHLIEPEGTYLLWLDFRNSGVPIQELDSFITQKANLWLDSGEIFGKDGLGFQRINIACPRSILKEALIRINNAFGNL